MEFPYMWNQMEEHKQKNKIPCCLNSGHPIWTSMDGYTSLKALPFIRQHDNKPWKGSNSTAHNNTPSRMKRKHLFYTSFISKETYENQETNIPYV